MTGKEPLYGPTEERERKAGQKLFGAAREKMIGPEQGGSRGERCVPQGKRCGGLTPWCQETGDR